MKFVLFGFDSLKKNISLIINYSDQKVLFIIMINLDTKLLNKKLLVLK